MALLPVVTRRPAATTRCHAIMAKKKEAPGLPSWKPAGFRVCACRGLAVGDAGLRADRTELLAEFLDATGGVDDLVLAGKERVRFSRHLDLDQRVFLTF